MKYKIDVIIPSLGGPKLLKTIKSLNKGSCKPKKIILNKNLKILKYILPQKKDKYYKDI